MIIGEDLMRKALIHIIKTAGIEYYPDESYVRLHVDPFEYESKVVYVEPKNTVNFIRAASKLVENVDLRMLTHRDFKSKRRNPIRISKTKTMRLKKRDLPRVHSN